MVSKNVQTIFIRNDDLYRKLIKYIANELERSLVPLFGAGISFDSPSNLPLANHLSDPLISTLWKAGTFALKDIHPQSDEIKLAEKVFERVRLERLLDALHSTHGQSALEYLSVLNGTAWNYNHASIAALAEHKYLNRCITLNFDLLIEKAIEASNNSSVTECPLTNQRFVYGNGPESLHILKPHGSFAPSHISTDPFEYLSATLSQVGSSPARLNIESFKRILFDCPTLFVSGYSDDDWDIFPILNRLRHLITNVIWVQYATFDQVKQRIIPRAPNSEYDALYHRIIPWLKTYGPETTLLVGPLKYFFEDLLEELEINVINIGREEKKNNSPDVTPFLPVGDQIEPQGLKTIVSLAILIQQTGTFSLSLLKWLQKKLQFYCLPELSWRVENLLGHTKHTWGDLKGAICHTKKVIDIKANYLGKESVAEQLVWLGYEYLCMAKRPNIKAPLTFLKMPIFVYKGLMNLRKGVGYAGPHNIKRLKNLASYYKIDLLHSWINLLMLFGPISLKLCKPLFGLIAKRYDQLSNDSDLMDGEYYWLRSLEAKLLSGTTINRNEVLDMLDEIERSYHLVQNNVQQGNTHAYRALISYVIDGNTQIAIKHLNSAEAIWITAGEGISAGFRRIILFRRFMGQVTFFSAIKKFIGNSDMSI